MRAYVKFIFSSVVALAALVFLHVSALLIVDPLWISPFSLSEKEFYIKQMRFQAATIINKVDFDSAVLGTSMAQNFSPKMASDLLGGRFVNLSESGALLRERKVVLGYLLEKKKVRNIIISLDGAERTQRNKGIDFDAWGFLYNESEIDDWIVYVNRKFLRYVSCHSLFDNAFSMVVFGRCRRDGISPDLEGLTEWQSSERHNRRFGGIENWREYREDSQVAAAIRKIKTAAEVARKGESIVGEREDIRYNYTEFEDGVMPFIRSYNNTRFILFFPPYSIVEYAIAAQAHPELFLQYKNYVCRVVESVRSYPNAEVYWFNSDGFILDLSNYKDLTHYSAEFNDLMLRRFAFKKSIINAQDCEQILSELEAKAKSVDLMALASQFER